MAQLIALLTDFGYRDYYVGALKGVIKQEAPEAEIVDITHGITPFSIWEGAFSLYFAFNYFPPGTVFLGVVDPGVGTRRRILFAEVEGKRLVGPDNGLFYPILKERKATFIKAVDTSKFSSSYTFQGRDVMARVAARLASGIPVDGFLVSRVSPLRGWSFIRSCRGSCEAKVLYVDVFGNIITNIWSDAFRIGKAKIRLNGQEAEAVLSKNYSKEGVLLVPGGYGLIEISIGKGSAEKRFGAKIGSVVTIEKI
ncbi:MAG: SAM hydrolase/SAM-dependent halogenase family protein [Thermoprotei archaeon]|nr:SAM-dependent chlorinase/fluorinase [TACK group archaeon]